MEEYRMRTSSCVGALETGDELLELGESLPWESKPKSDVNDASQLGTFRAANVSSCISAVQQVQTSPARLNLAGRFSRAVQKLTQTGKGGN